MFFCTWAQHGRSFIDLDQLCVASYQMMSLRVFIYKTDLFFACTRISHHAVSTNLMPLWTITSLAQLLNPTTLPCDGRLSKSQLILTTLVRLMVVFLLTNWFMGHSHPFTPVLRGCWRTMIALMLPLTLLGTLRTLAYSPPFPPPRSGLS
jgi:hypothetical protein